MSAAGRIHRLADRDPVGITSALVGEAAAEGGGVAVAGGVALGDAVTAGVGELVGPADEPPGVPVDWANEYRAMVTPVSMSLRNW